MREAGECLRDQRGHMRVHRPGQVFAIRRAELAARHEDHVGNLRQGLDLRTVEQVRCDALDAGRDKFLPQSAFAEAGHADHALAGCGALGKSRQGRADLAADAQDDEIAWNRSKLGCQRRRRHRHNVLKMADVTKAIRQCGDGFGHSLGLGDSSAL